MGKWSAYIERQDLVDGRHEEIELAFEITKALEECRAFRFEASEIWTGEFTRFFDVPVNIFVELIALGFDEVSEREFVGPMPQSDKIFVGAGKIGLGVDHSAAQGFENFALRLNGGFDLGIPGETQCL